MTNQAALAFFNFNKNSVIQISGYTAKKGATSLFVPGSHTEYCLCYLTVQRHILPGIPGTEPASSTPAVRHPQQSFLSPRRPRDPGASTSPLASRDLGPQEISLSPPPATPGPQEILLSPPPATPGPQEILLSPSPATPGPPAILLSPRESFWPPKTESFPGPRDPGTPRHSVARHASRPRDPRRKNFSASGLPTPGPRVATPKKIDTGISCS